MSQSQRLFWKRVENICLERLCWSLILLSLLYYDTNYSISEVADQPMLVGKCLLGCSHCTDSTRQKGKPDCNTQHLQCVRLCGIVNEWKGQLSMLLRFCETGILMNTAVPQVRLLGIKKKKEKRRSSAIKWTCLHVDWHWREVQASFLIPRVSVWPKKRAQSGSDSKADYHFHPHQNLWSYAKVGTDLEPDNLP